jgi:hypothetical protein
LGVQATVLEVILIAAVGAYVGFLVGMRLGVVMADRHRKEGEEDTAPAASDDPLETVSDHPASIGAGQVA